MGSAATSLTFSPSSSSSSSMLKSPLKNHDFSSLFNKSQLNPNFISRNKNNNRVCCALPESGVQENPQSKIGVTDLSGSGGVEENPEGRNGVTGGGGKSSKNKMEEYNKAMKRMMRNPYEYHHDLGMNYNLITENMLVGSQPQKAEDIDHLKEEENVAYILNLQQDSDIEYFGVDLEPILQRCRELGIRHMRRPARDFDGESLRNVLPKAVSSLEWAIAEGKGRVYVHCTAGLGRAPAVGISYMYWFLDMDLKSAYEDLTSKRTCGPNKRAIRGATYDLAKDDPWKEPFDKLPEHAFEGISGQERKLIQDRVHALRGT